MNAEQGNNWDKDLMSLRPSQYGEFACKSHDAVRWSIMRACADEQPIGSVRTSSHAIQTFREGDWKEWIPPIRIFPTLFMIPWPVNITHTCFRSLAVFLLTLFAWLKSETIPYLLVTRVCWLPWLTEFCIPVTSPNIMPGHMTPQ